MPSPMVRKEQQIGDILELVRQVYGKMSIHDKRIFVRGLAENLALKLSPADRDEWIEKMRKHLEKKTPTGG